MLHCHIGADPVEKSCLGAGRFGRLEHMFEGLAGGDEPAEAVPEPAPPVTAETLRSWIAGLTASGPAGRRRGAGHPAGAVGAVEVRRGGGAGGGDGRLRRLPTRRADRRRGAGRQGGVPGWGRRWGWPGGTPRSAAAATSGWRRPCSRSCRPRWPPCGPGTPRSGGPPWWPGRPHAWTRPTAGPRTPSSARCWPGWGTGRWRPRRGRWPTGWTRGRSWTAPGARPRTGR